MPKFLGVGLPDVSRTVALLLFTVAFFLTLHWVPQLAREHAEHEFVRMQEDSDESVRRVVAQVRAADPAAWATFEAWQDAENARQFASFQDWKEARNSPTLISLAQ